MNKVVEEIRARYGEIARTRATAPAISSRGACCTPSAGSACCGPAAEASPTQLYTAAELAALPEGAYLALGTGAPVRHARPRPGETVLDLGSGAGVDAFLASRAVGPTGRVIGVDFTPDMVRRARANAEDGGYQNVTFHEAPIERVPLPDMSVDVIVSNCVINLSVDKPAVLAEAHRVMRPGGRFVVSDVLRIQPGASSAVPACDCTTGAMGPGEWKRRLLAAGFADVQVQLTRSAECCGEGNVGSAIIRARAA